jgi:hypothetical protein
MSITLTALQKQRRDTAANWTTANPTLLAGEIGIESDTGYWKVGDGSTAWTSLAYLSGLGAEIPVGRLADGTARQLLQTDAAGTGVEWASNIDVPGTLDVTGAATFDAGVTIQGDLTVNGTTTTIDTQNLIVEDKNIEIGKVATPTDVTADGGGITLKGSTDKTINWVDATDAWTFSEHVNIASAKEYRIAGTKVLDATSLGSGVVSSSLTSVGTIGTGTWQGAAINKTYLDATLVSTGDTGTVTSTMIANGTIVNEDINASAAIAGTKISPDFGGQTVTTTGVISAALGSASAPSITFTGDLNTGIYSPGADQFGISTGGTSRLIVEADGDINIDSGGVFYDATNNRLAIGTNSPSYLFDAQGDAAVGIGAANSNNYAFRIRAGTSGLARIIAADTSDAGYIDYDHSGNSWIFRTSGSEACRIDSSQRLLVGTSTSVAVNSAGTTFDSELQVAGSSASVTIARTVGSGSLFLARNQTVNDGSPLGFIGFQGGDGTSLIQAASIQGVVDGTPGANDMPGRLVFSTTADVASSPTERMRIKSDGLIRSLPTYNSTTANAANMYVWSDGDFARSTSSGKYKTNVETLEDSYADAVLGCRPVWYRSICEKDNPNYGWWGFIAEEVAAIDPRLVHWKTVEVTYDEKGSAIETPCEPEPEGVAYDRFIPHLLNLIKRQKEQIEAMEVRLSALEAV